MKIAVIGGKLQGLEICYLGRQAGFKIVLIDRNTDCLAKNLCDEYYCVDVLKDKDAIKDIIKKCDAVIPAVENKDVLNELVKICNNINTKLLFDAESYEISSSKLKSDRLFQQINVPAPKPYPECDFPILVKPSDLSGSKGVRIINSQDELNNIMSDNSLVIQEYLEGKSYSIEIVGLNGKYRTFQVTEIIVDEIYDCKRVVAYTDLNNEMIKSFEQIAFKIAKAINLQGIMDVEVILNNSQLKVLEIDARFPSQTPITVYKSTGQNILEYLCTGKTQKNEKEKGVVFQHIKLKDNVLKVAGEHIMENEGNLELTFDFFGADEAITNFNSNSEEWAATLIIVDDTIEKAEEKKSKVIDTILKTFNIEKYEDLDPDIYKN